MRRTGGRAPRTILLQNHGLIVGGDTAAEIDELSHEIAARIAEHTAGRPAFSWGAVERIDAALADGIVDALRRALGLLLSVAGRPAAVVFDDSPLAIGAAGSELGRRFARGGPLTPDQIVYAGSWPLVMETVPADGRAAVAALQEALAERAARDVDPPVIVLVAGLGLFTVGGTERQADTARELYLDAMRIASGAHRLGGVRPLAPAERQFIERWEAEAYRRQIAFSPTRGCELASEVRAALLNGARTADRRCCRRGSPHPRDRPYRGSPMRSAGRRPPPARCACGPGCGGWRRA